MRKVLNQIYPLLIIEFIIAIFVAIFLISVEYPIGKTIFFSTGLFVIFSTIRIVDIIIKENIKEENKIKYELIKIIFWFMFLLLLIF